MWINMKWKLGMSVLVAASLTITQLEPPLFAQGVESNAKASVTENQSTPPADAAAQKPTPPVVKKNKRRLRWLLIGAAAVGAVGATLLLKSRKTAEPVVTVGGPTVGNPR